MEIERKFLIKEKPPIIPTEHFHTKQAYVSIDPEVRVREKFGVDEWSKCGDPYKITVKGDGTLAREEIETPIDEKFYNKILKFIGYNPISKDYYIYYYNSYIIEVSDVDFGAFTYAEVEFDSIEEANNFVWPWPEILISEETENPEYKMKNYWIKSRDIEWELKRLII